MLRPGDIKIENPSKKEFLAITSASVMEVQPGNCHVSKGDPLLLWDGEKLDRPTE